MTVAERGVTLMKAIDAAPPLTVYKISRWRRFCLEGQSLLGQVVSLWDGADQVNGA